MLIATGATDVSIDVQIVDDSGLPVTGLVAATMPAVKFSRGVGADVTISLSDLSALTDAHTDGGVRERGEGVYRLDLPDAVGATAGEVTLRGEATGKRLIASKVLVDATITSRLASASYTTPPTAGAIATQVRTELTTELDEIGSILADTNELQTNQGNWVTATGFSTFDPLTDQVIVATNNDKTGYSLASGAITASVVAANAFDNGAFTTGFYNSINAQVDTALTDYDAPTKTEMDAGFAALNDLSTGDIDARLAAYDAPTNTEMVAAFTEIKGAGWSSSTDTLEKIRDASGGGSSTVVVSPMTATVAQRVNGTEIVAYQGDTSAIGPIAITDADDNAVDLSGMTLRIVIESPHRTDLAVIAAADITVSGASNNQVTFAPNAAAVATPYPSARWSLRNVDDGDRVLAFGVWRVVRVATEEA